MIDIVKGSTKKTISSDQLVNKLSNASSLNGVLYIGYPIFSTPEGKYPIDSIFISPEKGVVLINLVEGTNLPDDYKSAQDDLYNKLDAKLRNNKILMNGRSLDVPIHVITFAPAVKSSPSFDDDYPVCSENDLVEYISRIENKNFEKYTQTLSVIQSISSIRKGTKKRNIEIPESRGAKLQNLEDSIANLDNHQTHAVVETIDDVQRIRGLAGSGKTIVLALKAAYLHVQHPDWKIAVTFNTRSLKEQFKRLINTFTIEQIGEEPNWDNLKIIHAWGSSGQYNEGIYHNYCMIHDLEYYDYKKAKYTFGFSKEFEGACNMALKYTSTKDSNKLYDAILIDEAQDFPISFLRICYKLLGDNKRLVYAYDELQSLNSRSLPSPEIIFGTDEKGNPLVKLSDSSQDIILKKCYRNSKQILTTAHALGFGIYRTKDPKTGTGLIQMFDDSHLWTEVGYSVVSGELAEGRKVTLERTNDTSPEFLSSHSDIDDIIQFRLFETEDDQTDWLIEQIKSNIENDELRFDDIIVINPDPIKTSDVVGPIRAKLFESNISSHLAGIHTSPDVFFEQDSITFTGIFRAKGNEAGMVYIINAHDCYESFGNLPTVRNQLFTAITRSKAWVRVLGVGKNMSKLIDEFKTVKKNNFKLEFEYPTKELRAKLNIVNRDMSMSEKKELKKADRSLSGLLNTLVNGEIQIEDLDPKQLDKLKELLMKKE